MLLLLLACVPSPTGVAAVASKAELSTADWSWSPDEPGAGLGRGRLAPAGDLNGDGYADLVLSAPSAGGTGAIYVFFGGAGGLAATPDQEIGGSGLGDRFGAAVSGAGDVDGDGYADLAVGAPGWDGASADEGAVFVFHGSAAGLEAVARWSVAGGQENAALGTAVDGGDVNGDGRGDLVATAPYWSGAYAEEGVAWVWHGGLRGLQRSPAFEQRGGQDGAHLSAALLAPVGGDERFDDLIVGSPDADGTGGVDAGEIRAYSGSPAGILTSRWTDLRRGDAANQHLGTHLCSAGALGVGVDDRLYAPDDGGLEAFGEDVAGARIASAPSDEVSICGAGDPDGDGELDVVVGWATRGGLVQGAAWYLPGDDGEWEDGGAQLGVRAREGMGSNALGVGDLDGDGYDDLLVTAAGLSDPEPGEGGAVVMYGGPRAPWGESLGALDATIDYMRLGASLAPAGDVDGDGYPDLLVGAPDEDVDGNDAAGRAYLYRGGPTGYDPTPIWSVAGETQHRTLGTNVATVGDLDGDGWPEVAVSGGGSGSTSARVAVYPGTPTGPATTARWTCDLDRESRLHEPVVGLGDVNGDGYDDLAFALPGEAAGRVAVHHGGSSGPGVAASWRSPTPLGTSTYAGTAIVGADVNGDGYRDLVVGDPYFELFGEPVGVVWVYLGSASGLSATAAGGAYGTVDQPYLGGALANVGDVNGDGRDDLIASALPWGYDRGTFRLLLGSASGAPMALWTWAPTAWDQQGLGEHLAACDVNGDGRLDLVATYPSLARVDVFEHLDTTPVLDESWKLPLVRAADAIACAGDLDGDGLADLAVGMSSYWSGRVEAFRRVEE